MPRKSKVTYKRKGKKVIKTKKKASSKSKRLANKKIDTLLEFRMKEMIEDSKAKEDIYYTTKATFLDSGAVYPLTDIPVEIGESLTMTSIQPLYFREICRVGGYLETNAVASATTQNIDPRNMNIYIKSIKASFRVCNLSNLKVRCRLSIWKIGYNKSVVSNQVIPISVADYPEPQEQWEQPFTDQYRINDLCKKEYMEFANNDPKGNNRTLIGSTFMTINPPANDR